MHDNMVEISVEIEEEKIQEESASNNSLCHGLMGPQTCPPLYRGSYVAGAHSTPGFPLSRSLLQQIHSIFFLERTEKGKKKNQEGKMAVLGLSTAFFSPPRGSWIAVRLRQGGAAGRSLWLRRSGAASAVAARAEVSFVDGDEAKRLVAEEGYTVLDVRDRRQYERAHVKASAHVPLFIENDDNDIGTIIKRQAHNNFAGLFYGLSFTKLNKDFTKMVKDKFSPNAKLLLVCQEGLRSTAAADALEREGFQNLACITSGLQTLKPGTFESVGKTELQNAGKAGLVTIQGKISIVLGTILISLLLFITVFPDQAEKLFELAGIKL
ncbi:hypothetical protein BRADI_4g27040v3 [Brachypodium distachyon]|uniref:Rhodanese domain-containing protein n=2 Tax=Brachypodium distachyon TaxID=15368 RepID=A0A0Q3EQC6_BRADI|nr:hypothetical protein BRADI_4g27040v3 [Brachypodium distachyon]